VNAAAGADGVNAAAGADGVNAAAGADGVLHQTGRSAFVLELDRRTAGTIRGRYVVLPVSTGHFQACTPMRAAKTTAATVISISALNDAPPASDSVRSHT